MTRRKPREAHFLAAAKEDIGRLRNDDVGLANLALGTIRALERREVDGVPLEEMATTGDLSDCRKLYFGVGNPPSHRIVYRDLGGEEVEIVEVVAVEAREELYAYLLAAVRLGRLPDESRPRLNRVHQQVIARRSAKPR